MSIQIEALKKAAVEKINSCKSLPELNDIRIMYLGKKGVISNVMQELGTLSKEERPKVGKIINEVKQFVSKLYNDKKEQFAAEELQEQLAKESIDVTLPGAPISLGNEHPLIKTVSDIEAWFISMGYMVAEGPEVESDQFNFEMLNLPKGHPARDMQDSFYLSSDVLLRTHTSPVQVRTLLQHKGVGPVKIISPGKVFRRDDDDATHSHQFMQIEALVVGEGISFADLKGTLNLFVKQVFGADREIRLRPSFFPFTEPSVEVDVSCNFCSGSGCSTCKKTGWIEILGAGMVHPNVLRASGFDPAKYTGFAFGIGVERIVMLKYGVTDIRMFYNNDLRFLRQFSRL